MVNDDPGTAQLGRSLVLISAAVLLNLVLGSLVRDLLAWPVYLDSIGTILVGALLGPLAGAATGVFTNLIWGGLLGDPSILPYTITAAFVGWAAGYAGSRDLFQRFGSTLLAGLLTGVGAALISAPITAYLLGDVTGGGTDYLTSYCHGHWSESPAGGHDPGLHQRSPGQDDLFRRRRAAVACTASRTSDPFLSAVPRPSIRWKGTAWRS